MMFGSDTAVTAHCDAAVAASEHFLVPRAPGHARPTAALLLRYCALPKLGHLARTTHPDALAAPAERFDAMALATQLELLRLDDASLTALEPRMSDADSRVLDPSEEDPPPGSQPRLSTERPSCVSRAQLLERIALPLSLGGLGLRPVHRIRHAAYYAALLQIVPTFVQLRPELRDDAAAWQQTQLYAELSQCREALLAAGAGNSFAWTHLQMRPLAAALKCTLSFAPQLLRTAMSHPLRHPSHPPTAMSRPTLLSPPTHPPHPTRSHLVQPLPPRALPSSLPGSRLPPSLSRRASTASGSERRAARTSFPRRSTCSAHSRAASRPRAGCACLTAAAATSRRSSSRSRSTRPPAPGSARRR